MFLRLAAEISVLKLLVSTIGYYLVVAEWCDDQFEYSNNG